MIRTLPDIMNVRPPVAAARSRRLGGEQRVCCVLSCSGTDGAWNRRNLGLSPAHAAPPGRKPPGETLMWFPARLRMRGDKRAPPETRGPISTSAKKMSSRLLLPRKPSDSDTPSHNGPGGERAERRKRRMRGRRRKRRGGMATCLSCGDLAGDERRNAAG